MDLGNLIQRGIKALKVAAPIIFAGALAVVQAIGEQQEQKRIDIMEERIKELESKNEES